MNPYATWNAANSRATDAYWHDRSTAEGLCITCHRRSGAMKQCWACKRAGVGRWTV